MSKSNSFENDLVALIFNAAAIGNIADNAGTAPLTNLYVSLHSADPGEGGTQATNEVAYTNYARVAVARSGAGWAITGNSVSPAADIDFAAGVGADNATASHFAIGVAASGATKILYSGTLSPPITITNGVTPRISAATTITED